MAEEEMGTSITKVLWLTGTLFPNHENVGAGHFLCRLAQNFFSTLRIWWMLFSPLFDDMFSFDDIARRLVAKIETWVVPDA